MFDIGGLLGGTGIELEQVAHNAFGAAVDQYGQQTLGNIFSNSTGNPFTGHESQGSGLNQGYVPLPGAHSEWNTTPYATDLINFQPKHRFLFRVMFEVTDTEAFGHLFAPAGPKVFQYIIKHIDKPTISFSYDDVNYYNFHTKVLKTITHDALSMTMIDDVQNTFYEFFRGYLLAHSPISRTYQTSESYRAMRDNGFNFSDKGQLPDSAIRGLLANNNHNILKSIKVFQYFANGTKINEFHFVNPRILDFNFDEHSHEGGDQGSHCTIRFDYDALNLAPTYAANGRSEYSVDGGTDMQINGGSGSPLSGINNPFLDMISAGLGQQASSVLEGFGNSALSGLVRNNPVLQGVSQRVTSGIGNIARNSVFGMTNGASPTYTTITSNISDSISGGVSSAAQAIEDFF